MDRKRSILAVLAVSLLALLALTSATNSAAQGEQWLVEGNQNDAHLGQTVARAGDVNGDGYGDLLVGGRYDFGDGRTGVAYAYYGSAQGPDTVADWTAPNDQPNQYAFLALAGAGDVNGDGYDDVVVGASHYSDDQLEEGRAYLFYGSPGGINGTPGWLVNGDQRIMYFGTAVAGAGDVNGDGYDDVLVGAPYKRDPASGDIIGQALLYLGSPGGLGSTPAWSVVGDGGGNYFGGRLNGAGDVNGDGYDDFMVSDYFATGDQQTEGRVFLYHGSANGPASAPAWTAEGDQAYAYFGSALGPAGDVNGDGFDDVVIGASSFNNPESNEGQARLYYGSASGLSAAAGWTAEGNQYAAHFGNAVSSTGDINSDGYDDVIIGAYGFDAGELSEGRAFLFLGSAGGLATEATWTADGDQAQANFGGSVSSAGDVNGDGRDEWAVGAPQYDRGEGDEGIAVLFDSLTTGPLPTPLPVTPSPTPTSAPPQPVHISDLDGSANDERNRWTAGVTAEVRDAGGTTVFGAVVSGVWSTGEASQCTTGVWGTCGVQLSGLRKNINSVIFTVIDVQPSEGTYDPAANSDPDGDSDGTQITVSR